MSNANSNINNLNVFTFIKDIYQSLKHIDKCFNDFNTNINTRITKIEDNQQILIDKMTSIEILLNKINEINSSNGSLNKNIENELLEKMSKMNNMNNNKLNSDYKVELSPDELTFANILENNYTFQDINSSISEHMEIKEFKSSSSGSNYYDISRDIYDEDDNILNNRMNNTTDKIEKIETLNNLLF